MAKKDILKGRSIVGKNIFDTANQSIEELKRANPLLEYFKSKNVRLSAGINGEYKGLCPFHNDTNPSLSVNAIKQVFNCFGCGKSGTVIDAVALFENVTRDEAIKLLKKPKPAMIEFPEKEKVTPEDLKLDLSGIDTDKSINDDHGKSFDLNKVTEYYHKKLFENKTALDYLSSRGIKSPEIISRFKIGFSGGSLLNVIGDNQKKELTEAGIINQYGHEVFNNCIEFPIFDDNGNTAGMYGRNIDDNAKVRHVYLKGKHRGVFNRKASKVYDDIILTESIIDALSLIELGFESVQACYGVSFKDGAGFTDEHLETLKSDRVKTVVIAFDNDDAGIKASEELKSKLINENFKVKVIRTQGVRTPSTGKDWNDSLREGISKEEIQDLIDKAEVSENKQDEDKDFIVKAEGNSYNFAINDIAYQVTGVKEMFVSNLKVNIKVERQGERFPDNLDLYSYRSRKLFSMNAGSVFGIEAKRIEKDLLSILDYLESVRDRRLAVGDGKEIIELTEEEKRIGLEFLKSPGLFSEIVKDMEVMGYVGEDLNKILLYLAASSRLLDDPISVMIISQSAAGKSMLVETLRKLLPSDEVVALTSLSDQALNYIFDLKHKFLIMGEAVHNEIIEHQIRDMLSNHELSRLVPIKDEKTGKMKSEQIITKAVVSMVLGGTRYDINPENASRFFIVNADESLEQTSRIHEKQKEKHSLGRMYVKEDVIPRIITKHRSAQRLLRKIMVVNPFRKHLKFPNTTMRTRRDFERFIDLIAVTCFLCQYQKEEKSDGRFIYIECDLPDYEIAYDIMIQNVLPATMQDISSGALSLYDRIRQMAGKTAKDNGIKTVEVNFIQRDIRDFTGLNADTIKKHLRILVDNEYIQLVSGRARGTRFSYKLREDRPADKLDLSMIPTPAEMKKLF